MPQKITVEFDGDPSDLIADVDKVVRKFDAFAKKNSDIAKSSQNMGRTGKQAFTELNSALSLVTQGFRYVSMGLDATTGKTVEYANNVRLLGQINGETAESNSRLIQTLDDYKISVTDITTASKKLKDQGLSPNIETVIKLASEYQKIQDPAEKLKFAQDNLGKSSKAWLEVLEQSPEALRKQAAGISENLILTQKQVDAARKLELAEDAKNDALEAVAVTYGNKLIPIQTDFYNGMNVLARGIEIAKEKHITLAEATDIAGREIYEEQQAMIKMKDAAAGASDEVEGLSESQADAEESAKKLSSVYQGLLSSMFSIQSTNDAYAKTTEELTKKDEELAEKKNQLTLAMWEEQRAGKLTNEENLRYIQQLADITNEQEQNAAARDEAAADLAKAAEQRKLDLVQERLGADGLISSGEYEYIKNLAVERGVLSRSAADQAISESKAADAMVASFEQTLPPMERTLGVMQQIAGYNGTTVNFGVNFKSNAPPKYSASGSYNAQAQPGGYGYQYGGMRDSGGSGMAGTAYMIGKGAQPEMFVPQTNGTFIPNADKKMGGDTYNIVINNPVPVKAEDDIRKVLKMKSATGKAS